MIVMIATLWDAVTDPAMGIITDRTRSRTGKHRRYLLWGIPVLFVSYTLLWNSFGLSGSTNPKGAIVYEDAHDTNCFGSWRYVKYVRTAAVKASRRERPKPKRRR